MGHHGRKIGVGSPPDDGMVNSGASDPQGEIAGRHMHILNGFIGTFFYHSPHTGHFPHTGPELNVSLFFYINDTIFIKAVFFPDGRIFYRMVVVQRETLSRHQRQDQKRGSTVCGFYMQFQPAGNHAD